MDSVNHWLLGLKEEVETECMSVLQGKSLSKESSDFIFVVPKLTKDHVVTIHQTLVLIKTEIKKLLRLIEIEKWSSVHETSTKLIRQIKSQISNCKSSLRVIPSHVAELQTTLLEECSNLAKCSNYDTSNHSPGSDPVTKILASIEHNLQKMTDNFLCHLVKNVVDSCARLFRFHEVNCHQDPGGGTVVSGTESDATGSSVAIRESDRALLIDSLHDIIVIGLLSNYMCSILAKAGAVGILLEICRSSVVKFARCEALRTLATICCVSESIERFNQNGGISCLAVLLTDSIGSETVRSEAAGVIAQVTSPSLANCQLRMGLLEHIPSFIKSLTGLCRDAGNPEIFLISCAALANLASIDDLCSDYFDNFDTLMVLTESCSKGRAPSIFAKEQVVTVVEAVTCQESSCKDMTPDIKLAKLLVSFLKERSRDGATALELVARENLLRKTALTVGRLCQKLPTAVVFVKLHCIRHLVRLCQDPSARQHSDVVLTACLDAIRRIFSICGPNHELLKDEKEANKLVASQLIDSYVLCSSADESFI